MKRCTDTRHAHRVHRAPAHGDPASASSWQPQPPDRRARPNQRRVRSRGCARRAAACKRSAWGARAQTHAVAGVAPVSDAGQRSPRTHVPALAQAGWVTGAPTRRCAHRAHGCPAAPASLPWAHTPHSPPDHTDRGAITVHTGSLIIWALAPRVLVMGAARSLRCDSTRRVGCVGKHNVVTTTATAKV